MRHAHHQTARPHFIAPVDCIFIFFCRQNTLANWPANAGKSIIITTNSDSNNYNNNNYNDNNHNNKADNNSSNIALWPPLLAFFCCYSGNSFCFFLSFASSCSCSFALLLPPLLPALSTLPSLWHLICLPFVLGLCLWLAFVLKLN